MSRVVFALAVLCLTSACAKKTSPEEQIRKMLDEGAAALEARDAKKAAEVLADDYSDKAGRKKDKLKGWAFLALQQGPVLVSMQNVVITVNGDRADVAMKVLAVQGSSELKSAKDLLPTNARSFDLTLKVAREDGAWKVTDIEGLGGGGYD